MNLDNFIFLFIFLSYILYLGVIVVVLMAILSPKFRKELLEDWYRSSHKGEN